MWTINKADLSNILIIININKLIKYRSVAHTIAREQLFIQWNLHMPGISFCCIELTACVKRRIMSSEITYIVNKSVNKMGNDRKDETR